MKTEIPALSNYYGSLNILEKDGKFYWSLENYDGFVWVLIPESLYREVEKYAISFSEYNIEYLEDEEL